MPTGGTLGAAGKEITMFLYLVQHAQAKPEEEDPSRSLTPKGVDDVVRVASHLGRAGITLDRLYHSPKLRAQQTAEIMARQLKPVSGFTETEGLAPMDPPALWEGRLKELTPDVMLVGHLPHMERLTSLLITGNPERKIVSFTMGGVVCLVREESGSWSVRWMITPEIALQS